MTSRRSALKAILAACAAPAFVPVERLMRIKPIVLPRGNPALYEKSGVALAMEDPVRIFRVIHYGSDGTKSFLHYIPAHAYDPRMEHYGTLIGHMPLEQFREEFLAPA